MYHSHKSGAGDGNRTRIPSLEGWCPNHCATAAYTKTEVRVSPILKTHVAIFQLIRKSFRPQPGKNEKTGKGRPRQTLFVQNPIFQKGHPAED